MTEHHDETPIILTVAEIKEVAREATRETLVVFGVDASNPLEMQRDFQTLRDWRVSMDSAKRNGAKVAISTLVAGLIAALWVGIKQAIGHP